MYISHYIIYMYIYHSKDQVDLETMGLNVGITGVCLAQFTNFLLLSSSLLLI